MIVLSKVQRTATARICHSKHRARTTFTSRRQPPSSGRNQHESSVQVAQIAGAFLSGRDGSKQISLPCALTHKLLVTCNEKNAPGSKRVEDKYHTHTHTINLMNIQQQDQTPSGNVTSDEVRAALEIQHSFQPCQPTSENRE